MRARPVEYSFGREGLPRGWKLVSANDLCSKITKGTTPPQSELTDAGPVPFLRVNNLSFDGKLSGDGGVKFVSESVHRNFLARSIAYPSDILINIVGPPLGKIAILPSLYPEYNLNQAILIYRTDSTKLDSLYFLYYLSSAPAQQWLKSNAKRTSGQQNLTIEICKDLPVSQPPLGEQQAIARLLRTWDRAIEAIDKLINNVSASKRTLMRDLFDPHKGGQLFGSPYKQLRIQDVADINKRSLGQETPPDHTFRYISLSDIESGQVVEHVQSIRFSESPSRARRCIDDGDILMSTVRPNLQAFARVTSEHADCIASTGFAVISVKPGFAADYIYHYLFSPHVTSQLNALVVGSNYPAINSSDVENLNIYCPPLSEQLRIAKALNAADATHRSLKAQRECLILQKQALMQQLLTGKRRVRVHADAPREVMSA